MPNSDGLTPGANGGANDGAGTGGNDDATKNKSGDGKNGDDKDAGDKGDKGDGKGGDDKAGKIVFESQEDLDAMIQRRVARATKKFEDDAKLTNEQKIAKERDDALAEVRERDVRDAFVAKADVSPAIAQRIFRAYRDELEIDDKGKATNIDDVLKMAKKDLPQLFTKQSGVKAGGGDGSQGSGGDGKPGGDMNAALRRMAGRGEG